MLVHASVFAMMLFFVGFLEIIAVFFDGSLALSVVFLAIVFRLAWGFGGSVYASIVPTLFAFSVLLLLFFISSSQERQIFIGLSSLVFYIAILGIYRLRLYAGDMTAQSMLSLAAMATLFFLFSSLYGIFLNFQSFTQIALMVSYGIGSFCVAFSLFSQFATQVSEQSLLALIFGFFMAEIGWISGFWSFGYLTTGVISLIVISVPWDMVQRFSTGTFSHRRLIFHLMFSCVLLSVVLINAQWLPM